MLNRNFHILDILSITTGRLVSERLMDGVYDILGFLHQASLYTTQLPSACDAAKPDIIRQHPSLSDCDADERVIADAMTANPNGWVPMVKDYAVAKYGAELTLAPLDQSARKSSDPMDGIPDGMSVLAIGVGGE
jgi:hypothetical protein